MDIALNEWPEIARWRKAERERLIAARLTIPAVERAEKSVAIADRLNDFMRDGAIVSVYWPFRGEPDLRPWIAALVARGHGTALPVVVEPKRPLAFHAYRPGDPLIKGVWNIPVPAEAVPVIPDIVIAPVVGFDANRYRLGYGGGFFDRTLASLSPTPLVIGVGYAVQEIATIHPQAHDIPMDDIVVV